MSAATAAGAVLASGGLAVAALLGPAPVAAHATATAAAAVPVTAGSAAADCAALLVRHAWPGGLSALTRLDLPSATEAPLSQLDYQVNAIGYVPAQRVAYGIATRDRRGPLHEGRVVRLDAAGRLTDLGPVRAGWQERHAVAAATAGAVVGSRLYLRSGHQVYGLDVDPSSPTFLGVSSAVTLGGAGHDVDDFAADPTTGLLYGVGTTWLQGGRVVRIDPVTGAAAVLSTPRGLPIGTGYGSVVLGPGRMLYVVNNQILLTSRLYAVPLDGSAPAVELGAWPALAGSDAAGCLAAPPPAPPPPPPPPPPAPPPPPVPPGTTTVQPTTPPPTAGQPPAPPPSPTAPPATTAEPSQPPTTRPRAAALPRPPLRATADEDDPTAAKRRWGLTVLLLILGAGAVAARGAGRH